MTVQSSSADETRAFGERLGRILVDGDVVTLRGDLGAGKTTLVRGLARGLGVPDAYPVTSPTFVLLQTYPGRIRAHHMDFYRIERAAELDALGLAEWIGERDVALIEWFEKFPSAWTGDRIEVHLRYVSDNQRSVSVAAFGARGDEIVRALADGR